MLRKGFFEIAGISRDPPDGAADGPQMRSLAARRKAPSPGVWPGAVFLTGECRKIWEIFWHFMPLRHCIKVQKLV